jgi:cobalt-zinc-cadmium efflux system membrane fusion protein
MKKRFFINICILALVLAVSILSCGKESHEPAAAGHSHETDEGAAHSHEDEEGGGAVHRCVQVSPEVIKQWGIQYTEAVERDYVHTVTLTGVVKPDRRTAFMVNALAPGIVTAIKKDIGDAVKTGDVLCILNSPELLELKTDYIKSFQQYRLTGENYERAQNLFKIKAIEKKQLIDRETRYKTAMAGYFSLEAELSTMGINGRGLKTVRAAVETGKTEVLKDFLSPYYSILSPGPGKVMARDLSLGERIESARTIFEISDTRKVWVVLDALEKDLPYIDRGKPVEIETGIYPGEYFTGRVLVLMEKIDPELRTVKVRVEVDNPDGRLKPEMYTRGRIQKKIQRRHPAVPVEALVKLSGVDGVFVIGDGEFQFKAVQVIETDSEGYAFINGLEPGEMIISKGAFYLKAEYEIQSGKADPHAGHSH